MWITLTIDPITIGSLRSGNGLIIGTMKEKKRIFIGKIKKIRGSILTVKVNNNQVKYIRNVIKRYGKNKYYRIQEIKPLNHYHPLTKIFK